MNTSDTNTTATVTRKVGRPQAKLKLIMNKSFTVKDLINLNPDVKPITVRVAVARLTKNGKFTKLNRVLRSGRKGKPENIFINTKVYQSNLVNLAKAKTKVVDVGVTKVEEVF